jgi:hypothetical protein
MLVARHDRLVVTVSAREPSLFGPRAATFSWGGADLRRTASEGTPGAHVLLSGAEAATQRSFIASLRNATMILDPLDVSLSPGL